MNVPEADRTYKVWYRADGNVLGDMTLTTVQPIADTTDLQSRFELAKIAKAQCPYLTGIAVYDVQRAVL